MEPELEPAWLDSCERYDQLKEFVTSSASSIPRGDARYRANLYSSWILLTYAATEAALQEQGRACLRVIGSLIDTPADLPPLLMKKHHQRTLEHLSGLASADDQDDDFMDAISSINSHGWTRFTRLTSIDRNVWPNVVKEWLRRLDVDESRLKWMEEPFIDDSETASSRLKTLVSERNSIAHGLVPDNFVDAEIMCKWIDDSRAFVKQVVATLQAHLVTMLKISLDHLGEIDKSVSLGNSTVAFLRLSFEMRDGAHVSLVAPDGGCHIATVRSMQSNDVSLSYAPAGQERIAVTLSREIRESIPCRVI